MRDDVLRRLRTLLATRRWIVWGGGLGLLLLVGAQVLAGLRQPAPQSALATGAADEMSLALSVIFKLALVIALVYGSLYLLRRWQGGAFLAPARKQVAVLETTRLSPRQALHLVRVGGRVWLVGATDQAVTMLTEVEPRPETEAQPVATAPQPAPSFAEALLQTSNAQLPTSNFTLHTSK